MKKYSHAYIAIYDGICQGVCVDMGDAGTAEFVADAIKEGGVIERVEMDIAKEALMRPWPLVTT